MYLDIDRFKSINDLYGHRVGDQLLTELADRLRSCLRGLDIVSHTGTPTSSRLGGDEFAVLLPGVSSSDEAIGVAESLSVALSEPFSVPGGDVRACPSIGVAMSGGHYRGPSEIMRDADAAMYQAK